MARFSKKRGWSLFNRQAPENDDAPLSENVEIDDTHGTPPASDVEEEVMAVSEDNVVEISGDPIQHLFSTLGKFNRHLSQAQQAPDGAQWVPLCMNELAAGLEIAIACQWTPVKAALIDTARVLHSYDSAGRRRDSLPFLNDSYEILSLMVGDLIVDKVRSGVIQKWKTLYETTVAELEKAGIALVEDEEDDGPDSPVQVASADAAVSAEESDSAHLSEKAVEPQVESSIEEGLDPVPTRMESEAPVADSGEETSAEQYDDIPLDLPPLTGEAEVEESEEEPVESDSILKFPAAAPEQHEQEEGSDVAVESGADAPQEDTADDAETGAGESGEQTKEAPLQDNGETLFDMFQESMEAENPETPPPAGDKVLDEAPSHDVDEDTGDGEEMGLPEDTPPEMEEEQAPKDAEQSDADGEEAAAEAPEKTIARDKSRDGDEATENLFRRAQDAVKRGDICTAKSAALELALSMARLEYEQAQEAVARAEEQLVENAQSIKAAEGRVDEAELSLLQTEELLASHDNECVSCREKVAAMDEELEGFQSELDAIDAEIAALQRRRADQVDCIEAKYSEREGIINSESRLQTEMEALRQDADTVRQELERLRDEKKAETARRSGIEAEIFASREEAETRHLSLSAIEGTMSSGKRVAAPPSGAGEEDLL